MEPELGAAGERDRRVEMLRVVDVARGAGFGGEHPATGALRHSPGHRLAALENNGQLPGQRQLQRLAGLGLLDPECERRDVDAPPAQGQDLFAAHAGVDPTRIDTRGFASA